MVNWPHVFPSNLRGIRSLPLPACSCCRPLVRCKASRRTTLPIANARSSVSYGAVVDLRAIQVGDLFYSYNNKRRDGISDPEPACHSEGLCAKISSQGSQQLTEPNQTTGLISVYSLNLARFSLVQFSLSSVQLNYELTITFEKSEECEMTAKRCKVQRIGKKGGILEGIILFPNNHITRWGLSTKSWGASSRDKKTWIGPRHQITVFDCHFSYIPCISEFSR